MRKWVWGQNGLIWSRDTFLWYLLVFQLIANRKGSPIRNLRQRDPISLYLFLLCAKVFSYLLPKVAKDGKIHGILVCRNAPHVNHLFLLMIVLFLSKLTYRNARL